MGEPMRMRRFHPTFCGLTPEKRRNELPSGGQPRYAGCLARYSRRRRRALAVPRCLWELLADNLPGGIFDARLVRHRTMGRSLSTKLGLLSQMIGDLARAQCPTECATWFSLSSPSQLATCCPLTS